MFYIKIYFLPPLKRGGFIIIQVIGVPFYPTCGIINIKRQLMFGRVGSSQVNNILDENEPASQIAGLIFLPWRYTSVIIRYRKGATGKRSAPIISEKFNRLKLVAGGGYFFVKSTTRTMKSNKVTFVSFMGITPFLGQY